MNRRRFIALASAALAKTKLSFGQSPTVVPSGIMTSVLTRSYDNTRSGVNYNETKLTQANVKNLTKYFNLPMEGDRVGSEAQILIVPKVTMPDGVVRDICVMCEMNNLIWCYDANTSDILWVSPKLGIPVNGGPLIDMFGINDHWGILSTPVIDSDTNLMYVVYWSAPDGMPSDAMHYIAVINLVTGQHTITPVSLANLSYTTPNGTVQKYNSTMRKQRSSLVMTNVNGVKTVFFSCGTVLESTTGAAGWIIAFDVASNTISAAMTTTAGDGAGIWMGGQGLCADASGYLYGVTGNGSFDGVSNFGECIIKVQYTPGVQAKLAIVDWWSPYSDSGRAGQNPVSIDTARIKNKLSGVNAPSAKPEELGLPVNAAGMGAVALSDEDLGSAGLTLIPEYGLALACGKDGIAYIVNSNNMGKTEPTDFSTASIANNYAKLKQPPQWYTFFPGWGVNAAPATLTAINFPYTAGDVLNGGKTRHMHSTSIRWNSPKHGMMLFCMGENSPLRAWTIGQDGTLTFLAQSQEIASASVTAPPGGMPGGFMTLSCNGSTPGTGLLFVSMPLGDANKTVTTGRFICYDPENFTETNPDGTKRISPLWEYGQVFHHAKFNVPVVSGGKVFLPTYDDLAVVFD